MNRTINRIIAGALTMILTSSIPVYASDVMNKADTAAPLQVLYNFMLTISVPLAVAGFVLCGFSFFIPGERGWETAKKRMLYIGIALAGIFLIPAIMKFTAGSAYTHGWQPTETRQQIIPNKSENLNLKDMTTDSDDSE